MEKKAGGREAALKLFTAAAQKDPLDYKTWLAWAVFERRCERWAQAEQAFQRAADLAPYNYTIW
ncbi:TPR repeat-containing [Haematococcus lacustris]|uniref:TPR repeat-containing n=1 Tax=Haematococcus lacustris TaxID=44745 RepID=A0A699YD42_HAELA|nr:TPR repeat-containing [Haematococcus lacustris]